MLKELIAAINDVPEYIRAVIYGPHLWYAILAGVIFIVVLLITNRFTAVLRTVFVYASIAIAAFAFLIAVLSSSGGFTRIRSERPSAAS